MPNPGDYAIIDVAEGSISKGKILMLLDNSDVAEEIAADLRHRGCDVTIQPASGRHDVPISLVAPKVAT